MSRYSLPYFPMPRKLYNLYYFVYLSYYENHSVMRKFLFLLVFSSLFVSCSLVNHVKESYRYNVEKSYFTLTVIQTLDDNSALCRTQNYDIVKLEALDRLLYDGLVIKDSFVLTGTYRYVTVKDIVKTVPVYVTYDDYKVIMSAE